MDIRELVYQQLFEDDSSLTSSPSISDRVKSAFNTGRSKVLGGLNKVANHISNNREAYATGAGYALGKYLGSKMPGSKSVNQGALGAGGALMGHYLANKSRPQ